MVLPLILAIGGRIALPVILRLIARNRAAAIAKYGVKAVNKAVKMGKNYKGKDKSVIQAIKKVTKTVKTKKPFKVKFKAKTKKQIAIQKKTIAKYKKPTKVKTKPSKKVTVAKPKKVITKKPTKVKTKPSKKVTTAKPKKIITKKPTKIIKKKPSKALTVKKPSKALTIFKGKKPPSKVITKIAKVKKFKPGFWTGVAVGGAAPFLLDLLKKKKAPPLKPDTKHPRKPNIKPPIKIKPKPKPKPTPERKPKPGDTPPRFPGFVPKESLKSMPSGPQVKKKFTEERSKSFENRVRALVAQKDRLKNIEAGDGRSEYQVRMHKLKKENKKAWKKLFTLGGKLK